MRVLVGLLLFIGLFPVVADAQETTDSLTNNIVTTRIYRKGLYKNIYEFQTNSPSVTDLPLILDKRPDKEIYWNGGSRYRLYNADENGNMVSILPGDYWGYSDGENLYVKGPEYSKYADMEKLETVGVYCYFIHPVDNYTDVLVAGALFGFVGALVVAVATDDEQLAPLAYVINLNTGEYDVLRQTMATKILNTDLWLKKKVGPISKYQGDPKNIIIEYNNRNKYLIKPYKKPPEKPQKTPKGNYPNRNFNSMPH